MLSSNNILTAILYQPVCRGTTYITSQRLCFYFQLHSQVLIEWSSHVSLWQMCDVSAVEAAVFKSAACSRGQTLPSPWKQDSHPHSPASSQPQGQVAIKRDSVLQRPGNRLSTTQSHSQQDHRAGNSSAQFSACNEPWTTSSFQCIRTGSCRTDLHRCVALILYLYCALLYFLTVRFHFLSMSCSVYKDGCKRLRALMI